MKKIPLPTVITATVLVLILVVYMFTFQVRFSEAAIRVWLGSATDESVITEPGLRFRWPAPIEEIKTYDLRYRVLDTPETEVKTRDEQALIVGCFAVWKVVDPLKFYVSVRDERSAGDQIRRRINEARANVIGRHDVSEMFSLDGDLVQKTYDMIEEEVLAACAPQIRTDYGVEVKYIGIRRIALPAEATATVQESMRQDLANRATKSRDGGRGLATAIRAQALADQKKILAFTNARAQEIRSAGVKASAPLLKRIGEEDTEFFLWLRFLDALKASFEERATIFLDAQDILYPYFTDPTLPIGRMPMPTDPTRARGTQDGD